MSLSLRALLFSFYCKRKFYSTVFQELGHGKQDIRIKKEVTDFGFLFILHLHDDECVHLHVNNKKTKIVFLTLHRKSHCCHCVFFTALTELLYSCCQDLQQHISGNVTLGNLEPPPRRH